MSDLLNIGSSAVRAYKGALGTVGENVANAESPGYARRTPVLKQAGVPGISPDPVYGDQPMFSGVDMSGVQRAWDSFRAAEARHAAAASGSAAARAQWLGSVEAALGNGPASVGPSLTAFFNAGTTLAANPGEPILRSAMLMALEDVGASFRSAANGLQRVAEGIAQETGLEVEATNNALAALHEINGTLRLTRPGGTARAALEDQRDRLVDLVTARMDVTAAIEGDGTVRLALAAAPEVLLLDGAGPGRIGTAHAADGRIALQLTKSGGTAPLPVSAGRLAGLRDAAGFTADRRSALDQMAQDFAGAINAWSAAGRDAAGNPGVPLVDATGGAAGFRVLIDDPAAVAAASADGRANGNLLALEDLRGAGGAESRWTSLVAQVGQTLAGAKAENAAAAAWRDNSFAALDEVTGIDLDREAADLLRYQQAYSGATRIIQVARETTNAILELF